jgi:hypothetical protein
MATPAPFVRPAKEQGIFSALGSSIKSVANVVTDVGAAGSLASEGLLLSAAQFKMSAFDSLVDEYGGDIEVFKERLGQADIVCGSLRSRKS